MQPALGFHGSGNDLGPNTQVLISSLRWRWQDKDVTGGELNNCILPPSNLELLIPKILNILHTSAAAAYNRTKFLEGSS